MAAVEHRVREEAPGAGCDGAEHVDRSSADAVGQLAYERDDCEVHCVRDEHPPQDRLGIRPDLDLEVGDRERDDEVVHDVLAEPQAHGREHPARVTLEHLEDAVRRGLDDLGLLLRLEEDRGVGHLGADVVAHEDDDGGEPEGNAPAPAEEGLVGQCGGEDKQHDGGEQVAGGHARLRPAGPEAT